MKQTDPQFKLRLDADLKKWLEEQAGKNLRSVTNEIVIRLQRSREAERDAQPA
ncbi:Arc family DNA-binding protein [Inquilinus limosus]|uniref:Arc family DNA-binding protein n=1 Tax=Inquilinus limosus TaxID=171674 RepID=UPI0009DD29D4|nr:Arc family DNA-binding protein [Inquilinus limosus]